MVVSQVYAAAVFPLTWQRFFFSSLASSQASCWVAQNPRQVVAVVAWKSMRAAQGARAAQILPFFTAGQACVLQAPAPLRARTAALPPWIIIAARATAKGKRIAGILAQALSESLTASTVALSVNVTKVMVGWPKRRRNRLKWDEAGACHW